MGQKFDKNKILMLLGKLQKHIKETTTWFDNKIGDVISIKDITTKQPDDEILLSEVFLRTIAFTIKLDDQYINDPSVVIENVDVKKLMLIDMVKDTHLDNHLLSPVITNYDENTKELSLEAKLPINWKGNISKHFKNHWLTKCDVNRYFEYDTYAHICEGLTTGSIVSSDVLEILIGNKKYKKPKFRDVKSMYSNDLDESKLKAFNAALASNDITIIKGPPGTGKSHLIAKLIQHFVYEKNDKVIVASRTHSALDNIVERLSITDSTNNYTGLMLEKSSYKNINSSYVNISKMASLNIRKRLLKKLPANSETRKYLKTTFSPKVGAQRFLGKSNKALTPSVFLGTITSAKLETNIKQKGYDFDNSILIMDEVSKSSIIDVLRYATYAKKIILVGDNMQLSPIIDKSKQINDFRNNLSESEQKLYDHLFYENIFEMLYTGDENNLVLMETYRSPDYILKLYNFIAYQNLITSKVKKPPVIKFASGKNKLVKFYNFNTMIVDDPNSFHNQDKTLSERSKTNDVELENILEHLSFLSKNIENREDVSIMVAFFYKDQYETFFRNHNNKIKYYEKRFNSFIAGTIDQLQGKEADIVLVGTTYTNEKGGRSPKFMTLIQDAKRLNVGLSRAKSKLVVFGNIDTLKRKKIFLNGEWTGYELNDVFNKFEAKGRKKYDNKNITPLNIIL